MSTPSNATSSQDAATGISVGRASSGQAGATPCHENMQETGGNGGDQLTQSNAVDAPDAGAAAGPGPAPAASTPHAPADSGVRGARDTRGGQTPPPGSGLGTPETGANQKPDDLAPAR
jgi:hypothetical protein